MKRLSILALALATAAAGLGACTGTPGPMVEAGYPTGSLALAAIQRQDWTTAERLLTRDGRVDADDPARLINLGRVYLETGRSAQALAVWQRALAARQHHEVDLLDGRAATTDEVARQAIALYQRRLETAAR